MRRLDLVLIGALAVMIAGVVGWAATHRQREVELSSFVTVMRGRTPNQAHNAALAARSLNGTWIKPGETFSFNKVVGSWSSDTGYKRAPVSYDGELVPAWGGGVCQTSSTLYNAALLAGLTVTERHRHRWLAKYVAPGRDAAVAYSNIDLKLRNDHPWPVRLEAEVRGDLLRCRIVGPQPLGERYAVETRVETVTEPTVVEARWEPGQPARRLRNPGKRGCRVLTYRVKSRSGRETSRELLSDDSYPAMNRLLLTDNG